MSFLKSTFLISLFCLSSTVVMAEVAESPVQDSKLSAQQELVDLFFAAAKTGNKEVIDEFLKYGFPVNSRNHAGFTPLMMATYYGQQNIVSTLFASGADRCARDNKGNTALMGAIFKMEWAIARQLRKVDCDMNTHQPGQKTVAEFAKVIGQEQALKELLNE